MAASLSPLSSADRQPPIRKRRRKGCWKEKSGG
jgi:hypothetical protein